MILVDPVFEWLRKGLWCHMVSDTSVEELHVLAQRIGLKRCWYQRGHYDLRPSKRALAIAAGAVEVDAHELVTRMVGRKPKRLTPRQLEFLKRRGDIF